MKKKSQIIIVVVFIITSFFCVSAEEFGTNDVKTALEKADKLKSKIMVDAINNPTAQKAAEKAAKYFKSDDCRAKIQKETQRIKKDLFQEYTKDKQGPKSLSETDRVYIFISSSVPISTLRAYAYQIESIGDKNITMVMRGFIGGIEKFSPTMHFCRQVLFVDPDCQVNDCEAFRAQIQIDPNLFRWFGITSVPAIVYAQNVNLIDPEQSAGLAQNVKGQVSGYKLYGAVPLEYALDKFYQESKSSNLKRLLSESRGSRQ